MCSRCVIYFCAMYGTIISMENVLEQSLSAMKVAKLYFVESLQKNSEVRRYVASRISQKTIDRWEVGYNPGYGHLIDRLNDNNTPAELAEELGLIKATDGGKYKEAFRSRIMIPIRHGGKTVAFAGRIFGKCNQAKYINSKNSFLYNKNEVLFGLNENRNNIRRSKTVILVEGYFDLLYLYDKGIRNVACLGGVTLSDRHAAVIKRYAKSVIILTDGDDAGEKSATKIKKDLARSGLPSEDIRLPAGKDPDTFLEEVGKTEFLNYIGETHD